MHQMHVDRAAIENVEIVDGPDSPLAPGQARMSIERLALTANTITYAAAGDLIGYWKFFPIERDGWGMVPAWGFAVVVESTGPLKVGDRYYGFWPIATSVVVTPDRVRDIGFVDAAPHRASLPAIYNSYSTAPVSITFGVVRFMYHGICPLLFSTGEGFGSRRRARPSPVIRLVEAVHAACFLVSLISFPSEV